MDAENRYPTRAAFPSTRRSAIEGARSADAEERRLAYEALIAAYWRPVYAYLRMRRGADPDDAKDLTQGFFAHALERGQLARYDPTRAAFRTYLRTCLDSYASNVARAARAERRGGHAERVPLGPLTELPAARDDDRTAALDPDAFFHREWVRGLLGLAVDRLRERLAARGKLEVFELFERYDLMGPELGERITYADLARERGLPVTQVTNHLALARRELRALLLEALAEVTASDEEFRAEARALFGRMP